MRIFAHSYGIAAVAALLLASGCKQESSPAQRVRTRDEVDEAAVAKFTGSKSCRPCHERFYKLWAPSHHGKAMQPFTAELAKTIVPPEKAIEVKGTFYQYVVKEGQGWIVQSGKEGDAEYPLAHAMGGKNMYFFLTLLDKGKLQVLPISYDVEMEAWYDTMGSMVRHFDAGAVDEALHWKDPMMTFNTACYSCHVSQLSTNYNPDDGSYNTVWQEPGINCETCHGPASEHIRVYAGKPEGYKAPDQKIIVMQDMTAVQRDETCAPCHAKMHAITEKFGPGDRYFDHHDLATFEDRDFHPDGRDLGENYTYTLWLTNPCSKSGQLECLHCHTSSGRNRFAEKPNDACLPCHAARVANPTKHTHHEAGTKGNLCISCHMPMTRFAAMNRSDHSFRPPTPAAMVEFKSPSACNICHVDKKPEFLDKKAREWHGDDYQEKALARARLIDAARKQDWSKLDAMLKFMVDPESDGIFVNSLIRLLSSCPEPRKMPVLRKLTKHPMPIVRASAMAALGEAPSPENLVPLLDACEDGFRLVRIRAANALAPYPENAVPDARRKAVADATSELETSFTVRPDQWGYHYNRGNYLMSKGLVADALNAFQKAHELRDDVIVPLVNAAMAAAQLRQYQKAVSMLEKARQIEPKNIGVLYNLGLAYNDTKRPDKAKEVFKAALAIEPKNGRIAYNLGLMVVGNDPTDGIRLLRVATDNSPNRPDCAYALAFHLAANDGIGEAIKVLEALCVDHPSHYDGALFLASLYERVGRDADAKTLYEDLDRRQDLPRDTRRRVQQKLNEMK